MAIDGAEAADAHRDDRGAAWTRREPTPGAACDAAARRGPEAAAAGRDVIASGGAEQAAGRAAARRGPEVADGADAAATGAGAFPGVAAAGCASDPSVDCAGRDSASGAAARRSR